LYLVISQLLAYVVAAWTGDSVTVNAGEGDPAERRRMPRTLTVSGIAKAILWRSSPLGDAGELQKIMRQLRHWTQSDVLRPVSGLYIGTGRSREYAVETVMVAAVLSELSNLGMTIGTLKSAAADVLYDVVFAGDARDPDYWQKELVKKRLFLRLTFARAPGYTDPFVAVSVVLDQSWFALNECPVGYSAVVIDLHLIFESLKF
jgi:hypothetical protein